jgi:hypothetical protein
VVVVRVAIVVGIVVGMVDARAGAVAEIAAVSGTAELPIPPPLGVGGLPASTDDIVGTGPRFAGRAVVQPEITVMTAMAVHQARRADRCRDGCDSMQRPTLSFDWSNARSTVPS